MFETDGVYTLLLRGELNIVQVLRQVADLAQLGLSVGGSEQGLHVQGVSPGDLQLELALGPRASVADGRDVLGDRLAHTTGRLTTHVDHVRRAADMVIGEPGR